MVTDLLTLGTTFNASSFDWTLVRAHGIVNHTMSTKASLSMTCGRILAHASEKITSFREKMGIRVCSFKIGVTTNPIVRFPHYQSKAYTSMWVLWMSDSKDLIHMLEAALVLHFHAHVGCQNKSGTGGEGNLNCKKNPPSPPYFLYVTGGRADQPRRVGWQVFAGIGQAQKKNHQQRAAFWPTQLEYCSHDNTWPFTTLTPSSQFCTSIV